MSRIVIPFFSMMMFISCANLENEELVDAELNRNLELSNNFVKQSTNAYYDQFHKNYSDVRFFDRSSKWKPKVDSIKVMSDSLVSVIDKLIESSRITTENKSSENRSLIKEEDTKKLLKKLTQYENDVLKLDDEINGSFKNHEKRLSNNIDTTQASFFKKYFNSKTVYKQLVILNKFKNDIYIFEDALAAFCTNVSMPIIHRYEAFNAIIGQSSNTVKKGDFIEITAGIGVFTNAAAPKILINNQLSPINESAIAIQKITAPNAIGKYTVPIKIEFTNPDGTKAINSYVVEYTVKD